MTDKELLELAAETAGFYWNEYDAKLGLGNCNKHGNDWWNPLIDDGDALRLAVICGIVIEYRREVPACFAYHYSLKLEVMQRNDQADPYAATRRAIVRAAAEIGKEMK